MYYHIDRNIGNLYGFSRPMLRELEEVLPKIAEELYTS
jgi:hypothetical protein